MTFREEDLPPLPWEIETVRSVLAVLATFAVLALVLMLIGSGM